MEKPITWSYFPPFSGKTPKKKLHPLTLAPVVTPPEKKMQSVTWAQTPQPLSLKFPPKDPGPAKGHQVSVGDPISS